MKRLMLVAVMAFGTMTTIAQEVATAEIAITEVAVVQDDFAEVELTDLPEAVTAAVAKNYPTATISKAYINESAQYKLEVALEDGTSGTLYADAEGNWIEL